MKWINSSVEIVPQMPGMIGMYKHIEKAMRNCYKSEDKIDDTSYQKMLDIAKNNHHYSPLEHGTVYLKSNGDFGAFSDLIMRYSYNPYSKVTTGFRDYDVFVTTNFRVLVENDWLEDLKYMCEPTDRHERRVTFKVECSEAIAREWNRHRGTRGIAISQQSTRYCNYSKEKFGSELNFIIPQWIYDVQTKLAKTIDPLDKSSREWLLDLDGEKLINALSCMDRSVSAYVNALKNAETEYMYLTTTDEGTCLKPQEARGILPLDTATCVYYTTFVKDWEHFLKLRTTQAAHPDIRILANAVKSFLEEQEYI